MAKIAREWTTGLSEGEAKAITDTVLYSTKLFDRIKKIISQRRDAIAREEAAFAQYDKPNWEYRQAHLNGRKQDLKEFEDLFTIT